MPRENDDKPIPGPMLPYCRTCPNEMWFENSNYHYQNKFQNNVCEMTVFSFKQKKWNTTKRNRVFNHCGILCTSIYCYGGKVWSYYAFRHIRTFRHICSVYRIIWNSVIILQITDNLCIKRKTIQGNWLTVFETGIRLAIKHLPIKLGNKQD